MPIAGVFLIMSARSKWNQYKEKMKTKRNGAKGGKKQADNRILQDEVMVVQRLSAEVSGKAQKYSRVGAREFVPFHYDEVDIANIKEACTQHYAVSGLLCDVLAGEQGPSCLSLKQIPDLNVIHVRFIEPNDELPVFDVNRNKPVKYRRKEFTARALGDVCSSSVMMQQNQITSTSSNVVIPKSLSLVEMLKIGKVITDSMKKVEIFKFDVNELCWTAQIQAEFHIEENSFSEGGFRRAFKASSPSDHFKGKTWVVKRYLPKTEDQIAYLNLSIEEHTRKQVQMHSLAMHLASKMRKDVRDIENSFGETFTYNEIFLGKINEEFVTIEEYIPGKFQKYISNDGTICSLSSATEKILLKKAECFVHYSWEKSQKELIVTDIQGVDYCLCDPEIASRNVKEGSEVLFTAGNLSLHAIQSFQNEHMCNEFCEMLGLQTMTSI